MKVPVVFAFDANYALPASVAIRSLLEHAAAGTDYDVVVLHCGLEAGIRREFDALAPIRWIEVDGARFRDFPRGWSGLETWFRILLADLLPDYEKVVAITGRAVPNGVAADATPQANPELPFQAEALVLQGEALVELARFDDAKLVFERVGNLQVSEALKRRASLKRADCLFAMGADDANRYRAALDAYRALLREDDLSDSLRIVVAFKAARSMEKLRRQEEAIDFYYQNVVLVYYWEALRPDSEDSTQRHWFDGNARDLFARAALTVGDYYESRGELKTAVQVLGYLVAARMPASEQAAARIARIKEKGGL